MGYTTNFDGKFNINKEVDSDTFNLLEDIYENREECEHKDFQEVKKFFPDSYLQWILSRDRKQLVYDGGEKFRNYLEHLEFLIEYIFKPKGYILNGEMFFSGEETRDIGKIIIENNVMKLTGNYYKTKWDIDIKDPNIIKQTFVIDCDLYDVFEDLFEQSLEKWNGEKIIVEIKKA